jgi:hypothetical protein
VSTSPLCGARRPRELARLLRQLVDVADVGAELVGDPFECFPLKRVVVVRAPTEQDERALESGVAASGQRRSTACSGRSERPASCQQRSAAPPRAAASASAQ